MTEEYMLLPLKGLGEEEKLKHYVMDTIDSEKGEDSKSQGRDSTKFKQLLRCPMYCRSNCASKHHPLLVALLNCKSNEDEGEMYCHLSVLLTVIKRYVKQGKWTINDEIPDSVVSYRYPMLHWAATLGNIEAVKLLLAEGMDPKLGAQRFGRETILQKAIICLQETAPVHCFEKFEQLVGLLEETLPITDSTGSTVLHTCCEYLVNDIPKFQYFQHCLLYVVTYYQKQDKNEELVELLGQQNEEGNTCLHILCRNDKVCLLVCSLLNETQGKLLLGVRNKQGQRLLEVAMQKQATSLVHALVSLYNHLQPDREIVKMEEVEGDTEAETSPPPASSTSRDFMEMQAPSNVVYDRKGNVIGEKLFLRPCSQSYSTEEVVPAKKGEPPMKIMKVSTEYTGSRTGEIILMVPETIVDNAKIVSDKQEVAAEQEVEVKQEVTAGQEENVTLGKRSHENSSKEPHSDQSHESVHSTPEKEAELTSCQSQEETAAVPESHKEGTSPTAPPKPEKRRDFVPLKTNNLFSFLRKHDEWTESEEAPKSYDQITPSNRTSLEAFLSLLTRHERVGVADLLNMDLDNLLKKLTVMSNTEEDLSYKYEALQDQQMKLVWEVQKLLHKLLRLKKEEAGLVDSIQTIQAELTTTHSTHQGLKERLQHCNAALQILEDIEKQGDTVDGVVKESDEQGST